MPLGSAAERQCGAQGKAGLQSAVQRVQTAIERGTFVQQCTSILMLRLTPVVPFRCLAGQAQRLACALRALRPVHAGADEGQRLRSASNYLLGLTPLAYPPFLLGSIGGMAVWASIYASLGGAGRTLLENGVSIDQVLAGG